MYGSPDNSVRKQFTAIKRIMRFRMVSLRPLPGSLPRRRSRAARERWCRPCGRRCRSATARSRCLVLDLLKEVVDKGDTVGIERQADAIGLLAAEGLAGDLVLTGLADQGALLHVVIDDVGVNAALLECLTSLLVGLELLLAGLGSELLQDGGAVGAGLDGDVLVGQVVDALDVVVIGEYQDGLLGVVVGTGKGDELLALIGNGVGGEDGVDLAVLQDGLTRVRGYLGDLDLVLAQNVVGQELCDTGVEAAGLTVFLVEEGEERGGLNATDLKDAGVLNGRGPGAGGDGVVIGLGAVVDELVECLGVERGGSSVSLELLEEPAAEPLSASVLVSEQPARPRPATVAKVAATKPRRSRTTCWERFLLMVEHLSNKIPSG